MGGHVALGQGFVVCRETGQDLFVMGFESTESPMGAHHLECMEKE